MWARHFCQERARVSTLGDGAASARRRHVHRVAAVSRAGALIAAGAHGDCGTRKTQVPDPDGIDAEMLRALPDEVLHVLCSLFDAILARIASRVRGRRPL